MRNVLLAIGALVFVGLHVGQHLRKDMQTAPNTTKPTSVPSVGSPAFAQRTVKPPAGRMSDDDKAAHLWGDRGQSGPVGVPVGDLAFPDPRVLSVVPESSHAKMAPAGAATKFRAYAILRVTLAGPLDLPALEELAVKLRALPGPARFDAVGLRFVLPGWPGGERDPLAGKPFYYWRLMVDGESDTVNLQGVTPGQAAEQLAALALRKGERPEGVWVDHYSRGGVLMVTSEAGARYLRHVADPDARWKLGAARSSSRRVAAAHIEYADGRIFKADGRGTDRLEVEFTADGPLRVFAGGGPRPYLIAHPWRK